MQVEVFSQACGITWVTRVGFENTCGEIYISPQYFEVKFMW